MAQTTTLRQRLAANPADKYVLWIVLVLAAVGVVAVYSAIAFLAETKAAGNTERFLFKHVVRVGLALGAMAVFSVIDYRKLARWSRLVLIGSLILLVLVKIFGVAQGGAVRSLQVGPLSFQPSDVAKVALILYVGVLLAKKQEYIKSLGRAFTPIFFWVFLSVALIGIEDLSTAALVLVSVMVMSFVGRVSVAHLGSLMAIGVLCAYLLLLASPGRAARIESYVGLKLFPNTNTEEVFSEQGEGYQAKQARIAFAMGGLTGAGPGKSVQRDFLPAPYNDFIFAIIAEEYGVLGALGLLALFVVLLFRGFLRIARHAPDPLGLFLGVGFTTMVALYSFIHAGVSCGLLPVTGLPMPFVSYGGTSMIATGVMIGILLNISRQAK
ncbi:MAG TPA: FtsW/RodA/SpoVE family cell cycle protein [Rhodothermales bacterium]|nr:FtsW/RodA/SpoVE family cell cycle protein [Rhodothermales bacterium]